MRSENFAKFVEYHTFDNNTTESDEFSDIGIVGPHTRKYSDIRR